VVVATVVVTPGGEVVPGLTTVPVVGADVIAVAGMEARVAVAAEPVVVGAITSVVVAAVPDGVTAAPVTVIRPLAWTLPSGKPGTDAARATVQAPSPQPFSVGQRRGYPGGLEGPRRRGRGRSRGGGLAPGPRRPEVLPGARPVGGRDQPSFKRRQRPVV